MQKIGLWLHDRIKAYENKISQEMHALPANMELTHKNLARANALAYHKNLARANALSYHP